MAFSDLKNEFRYGGWVQRIVVVSALLFVIVQLLNHWVEPNFWQVFALPSSIHIFWKQPWTLVTYAFMHQNIIHLLVNMLLLYFSGQLFTTFFTQKQLIRVFVSGAVFSGIIYLLAYTFFPALQSKSSYLVGSSGAIMALLFTTVTYRPQMEIRLALIGKVLLWHIAFVYILIEILQIPANNSGSHLVHFGGALFGFIYALYLQKGVRKPKTKHPFKKVYKTQTAKKPITSKSATQQKIDDILDKIALSGYESLTPEEKNFLANYGK